MSEDFEGRMREALQRRDPPTGFAERVLARVEAPQRRTWGRPIWAGVAIAAMFVAMVGYREVQQQRAEEAREQAMTALRITAEKLNVVRAKMLERENP